MSEAQTIAVQPDAISAPAAACPPSSVNSECWISSCAASSVRPSTSRIDATKPSILRWTGTNRCWPTASPILRWPSAARWVTASRTAPWSSGDTKGASTFSEKPLISTNGTPCPWSRA